jgi:hypothetical protein
MSATPRKKRCLKWVSDPLCTRLLPCPTQRPRHHCGGLEGHPGSSRAPALVQAGRMAVPSSRRDLDPLCVAEPCFVHGAGVFVTQVEVMQGCPARTAAVDTWRSSDPMNSGLYKPDPSRPRSMCPCSGSKMTILPAEATRGPGSPRDGDTVQLNAQMGKLSLLN